MISKEEKIKFLEQRIKKHQESYYNETSEISDFSYDAEEKALKELDPNNKLLVNVGAKIVQEEWLKAEHFIPMGSLDKVKNPEELVKWANATLQNIGPRFKAHNTFFITEKLDGLSIELIYKNGVLQQAITRGDGRVGFDITPNVKKMSGVKSQLPSLFNGSLRGEIILKKSVFEKFFQNKDYANTRNAASGISKRLDGVGCEHLEILFYQAIGDVVFTTEKDQFDYLINQLKLSTPNYFYTSFDKLENQLNIIIAKWDNYQKIIRSNLDWEIDGLVIRINELQDQEQLGELHLRPHGAIAFKFIAENAETTVTNIILQVGNSGRITPVVEVEPVQLMGAVINRASLYNFGYIQEIGLDIGARVSIIRANDVIPRCEVVIDPTGTIYQPPTFCPACNGRVVMNGENLQCINTDACPAQVVGRIKNWIGTLNLLEWGDKLIYRLVDARLVDTIDDLYKLTIDQLSNIDRMGKKSATKCYNILWQNKKISLAKFLGGLSIPLVGESTIQMLIDGGLDTLDDILNASYDDLTRIKGLGPNKAQSLIDGLKRNATTIHNLIDLGVVVENSKTIVNGILNNKSFCITGPTNLTRNELIKLIQVNGGKFQGSVNKSCSYLIVADPLKSSKKIQDAIKMGVQTISENSFLEIIKYV